MVCIINVDPNLSREGETWEKRNKGKGSGLGDCGGERDRGKL